MSLISLTIVAAGALLAAPSAGAGGWAVSTVDPMSVPVAGAATDVGFTIRQHGVRPINPDGTVGIAIESASGTEQFFDATARGATGHYVARVRFPGPGTYRWKILQGWFAAQDLGRIDVAAAGTAAGSGTGAPGSGTPGSTYRAPLLARVLLPVLGIGFGAFAIAEAVRARRRRLRGLIAT